MADYTIVEEALKRGYTMDEIADNLARDNGVDPADARGRGYTTGEMMKNLGYVKPETSDVARGFVTSFKQLPQLGYGLLAGAGAVAESVAGEGGVSTSMKNFGVKKYQEAGADIEKDSKQSDSLSYSWEQAKQGDFGSLVDWLQYGIGYGGGQAVQALATAGVGSLVGKTVLKGTAENLASKMVAKEALRLGATEEAKRLTAQEISKIAVANVASNIGQTVAIGSQAFGMEGGEIFGDLAQKTVKEGRAATGGELAKAFGATAAAGALEFVGDKLGVDVMLGKSKMFKPASSMTGVGGRAARAAVAVPGTVLAEGGTEYLQTGIEEYGKGNEKNFLPFMQSESAQKQALDAAGLGAVGGGGMAMVGGAFSSPQKKDAAPSPSPSISSAQTADDAIAAFQDEVASVTPRGSFSGMDDLAGLIESERSDIGKRRGLLAQQQQDARDMVAEFSGLVKDEQIDQSYRLNDAQQQRDAERARDGGYDLALQQREEQQGRTVEQLAAASEAQGFGNEEPTAMQLAMQRAQQKALDNEFAGLLKQERASLDEMRANVKRVAGVPVEQISTPQLEEIAQSEAHPNTKMAAVAALNDRHDAIQQERERLMQLRETRLEKQSNQPEQGAQHGAESHGTDGQVATPSVAGGGANVSGGGLDAAMVAADRGMRETVGAGAAVSSGGQVGAVPVADQPANVRALTENAAKRQATQLTNQGFPTVAYPHPTQPGMWAIGSHAEAKSAPAKEQQAQQAQHAPVEPAADDVPVINVRQQTPRKKPASNTLAQAIINLGGISTSLKQDITGDASVRSRPGLFTKNGTADLGELAARLSGEFGFTQIDVNDPEDNSGAKQLADLIASSVNGETILNEEAMIRAQQDEEFEQAKAEVNLQAQEIGIKPIRGKRTIDIVQSEINAILAEREEMSRQKQEAQRLLDEVAEQELIDAFNLQMQEYHDENAITRDERREESARLSAEESAQGDGDSVDQASPVAGRASPTEGGRGEAEVTPEFGLVGQTEEEAIAEEQARRDEDQRKADEDRAEDRRIAAEETARRNVQNVNTVASDNFQLGQSRQEVRRMVHSGMVDMFGAGHENANSGEAKDGNTQDSASTEQGGASNSHGERIHPRSDLPDGTRIVDGNGNPYRVHYQRNSLVVAHPIIDGKPVVSADTSVRFWVDPNREASGENDRLDPIYRDTSTSQEQPAVKQNPAEQPKSDSELQQIGSPQWALDMRNRGEVPEGWYVHGRKGRQDLNTNNVIQMTRDWDVADQYAKKDGSQWLIRPAKDATVLDLSSKSSKDMDRVVERAIRDFENGDLDFIEWIEASIGRDATAGDVENAVRESFAPGDIVNSAEAYDNWEFAGWLVDRFGVDFVETPDGAVAMDGDTGIEKVKVPNEGDQVTSTSKQKPADQQADAIEPVQPETPIEPITRRQEMQARGQEGLFEQKADPIAAVKATLDAAGVTGTDRTSTIAAVRRGDLTPEDVAEAHPSPNVADSASEGKPIRPYATPDERNEAIWTLQAEAKSSGLEYSNESIKDAAEFGAPANEIAAAIDAGEDAVADLAERYAKRSNGLRQGFGQGNNDNALRENMKPPSEHEKRIASLTGRGLYELTEAQRSSLLKFAKVRSIDAFEEIAFSDRREIIGRWLDMNPAETKQPATYTIADKRSSDVAMFSRGRGNLRSRPRGEITHETQRLEKEINRDLARQGQATIGAAGFITRSPMPDDAHRIVKAVEKLFGVRVEFVQVEDERANIFNGVFLGGNTLFVNVDSSSPISTVIGHEFLHFLKESNHDIYAKVEKDLLALANARKFAAAAIKHQPAMNAGEEVIADTFGDQFSNPEFWEELANRLAPSLFMRVRAAFTRFLGKLLGEIKAMGATHKTDALYSDLDAVRDAVLSATVGAAKGRKLATPSWSNLHARFMTAWHGSPHDHDGFDSSKIGTGEGAQAYGYGLYFAGAREVAEWYRNTLSKPKIKATIDGKDFEDIDWLRNSGIEERWFNNWVAHPIASGIEDDMMVGDRINRLAERADQDGNTTKAKAVRKLLKMFNDGKIEAKIEKGRLYQVELAPTEDELLDWDRQLSEQSEKVKAALVDDEKARIGVILKQRIAARDSLHASGGNTAALDRQIEILKEDIDASDFGGSGETFYKLASNRLGSDKAASEYIHSLGIRGIKYLDGSSRSAGEGNHNYVIFNDADVKITGKESRRVSFAHNALQELAMPDTPANAGVSVSAPSESVRRIQAVVERFKSQFKGASALDIRVVSTTFDIPARFRPSPFAEGVFHDDAGLVYLVTMNLHNPRGELSENRAWQVLLHESVGHYGLSQMMGDKFASILKAVKQATHTNGRVNQDSRDTFKPGDKDYATWDAVKLRYPDATDAELAQEVLARMSETDPGSSVLGYAVAVVRQWVRDVARAMGVNVVVSTSELRDLVAKASGYMRRGDNLAEERVPSGLVAASTGVAREGGKRGLESRARIIGDSGRQYTPEQQQMFKTVGREANDLNTVEKIKKWANKNWVQGIVDQFAPIKDIDLHAYTLTRLSKGAAGAFEAFMDHGKLSLKDGVYDADTSGGVMQNVFFPLGKETTDFLYWIAGNRAERLAKEGKERLFSPQDIAASKALAHGVADFDYTLSNGKTTRDRTLIYADSLKKFNEYNKNVMDMAEQSGLIDGASRHLWEHEFYVPFYRVMDESDGGVRGMNIKQGVVRQQAFKKLKGGEEGLNDLLANTLMNWAHLIDASAKNRAAKATLEAAQNLGIAQPAGDGEKKTVWYMDGGQKREYSVDDPQLLIALQGLDYAGLRGPIMDILSKTKHMLTLGVTASPFFKIRNLIRDSVQAVGTSDLSYNIAKNLKQGAELTNHERQEYVSALAGGALIRFGTMLEGNEAARTRQLIKKGAKDEHILDNESKVRAFYDKYLEPGIAAYNELGNRGEEINRMALYDQLIKQGKSHAEASLMARDLMDFSLQGSFTTIRFLTQTVPFMNARLQGLYKLGRSAKDEPAKMAVVTGMVALASLALLAAYGDDDDWKKREDWDRNNYWWFKFGGVAFRIPKPFELGAIGTLAERSAELLFDKEMTGKRFKDVVLAVASDQLAMNPVPQLVKPLIDIYANKDSFTKRPIESMSMERLDPQYRYNSGTSMVARGTSTAIGGALSPVQIDHLVRGYFGWLGSFAVGAADMAVRAASDEPTRPTMDYWKTATGGMVSDIDSSSSRYVSQMYEQAKELEQAYGTWRQLRKEGKIEDAAEYRADHDSELRKYRAIEGIKKAESKMNERIRMIERSNKDPEVKRELIRQIQKQKDLIARRAF